MKIAKYNEIVGLPTLNNSGRDRCNKGGGTRADLIMFGFDGVASKLQLCRNCSAPRQNAPRRFV